ncbi:MAG: nucleotidyltransferase family protein [Bacteroidales bacterium]|nr:nucleotidyltransferase family protein [Bacteroidales bacterium]
MKAMIFAAGRGTRLGSITKDIPKALVEINGIPVLEHTIRNLVRYGFGEIIINIHYFGEQVVEFLKSRNNFGIQIKISDESNELLDTGGGLKKAAWFFKGDEPFLVHNVDVLSDLNLNSFFKAHLESGALATLAVRSRKTVRYLLSDDHGLLCGWRNIKTGEEKIVREDSGSLQEVAFSGIHVISPELLKKLPDKKVFSMIEVYLSLAAENKIMTFNHDDTRWLDIGKPETLGLAEKMFPSL